MSSNNQRNKRRKRGNQQQQQPPEVPPGCSVCNVVNDKEPPKYKCPKCRATYCSVACCRQHKTVCPGRTVVSVEKIAPTESASQNLTQSQLASNANDDDSETDDDDDSSLEDGWKITDDMKVALRNSTWLRTELKDGGLRSMIASVVQSEKNFKSYHRKLKRNRNNRVQSSGRKNHKRSSQQHEHCHPHEELAAKRAENYKFDTFVDKLLVLADVLERQDAPMGTVSNRDEKELEEWLRLKWIPGIFQPNLALRPKQKGIPKFEPIDVSSSSEEDDDSI